MNIGILNGKEPLKKSLGSKVNCISLDNYSDFPSEKLNGLFIDWCSSAQDQEKYKKQGAFIDYYMKTNTVIIIFDRYFQLDDNEIEKLQQKNIFLYEPRLITRVGFSYMPFCCEMPSEIPLFDDEDDKHVDLGFKDISINGKIKEFDYYYLGYHKFSGNRIYYNVDDLNKEKDKLYQENGLINSTFSYFNCKCSILIGTNEDYYTGYLPEEVFDIISQGCIPLLPEKHVYFYGLFKDLVVENMKDIDWFINLYQSINYGLRVKFFERIERHYPLFNSDNLANYIISMMRD